MAETILKELRGNINENLFSKLKKIIGDKIQRIQSALNKLTDKLISKMSEEDIAN